MSISNNVGVRIMDIGVIIVMIVAGLTFVAFPVIYFGQIDGTTALVMAGGISLLVWAIFRAISLRKDRPRPPV